MPEIESLCIRHCCSSVLFTRMVVSEIEAYSLPWPLENDHPTPFSPASVSISKYPNAFSPARFIGSEPMFSRDVGHRRSRTLKDVIVGSGILAAVNRKLLIFLQGASMRVVEHANPRLQTNVTAMFNVVPASR